MHTKNEDFREISSFVESDRGSSKKLLERVEMHEIVTRLFGKVPRCVSGVRFATKNAKIAILDHAVHDQLACSRAKERFRGEERFYECLRAVNNG